MSCELRVVSDANIKASAIARTARMHDRPHGMSVKKIQEVVERNPVKKRSVGCGAERLHRIVRSDLNL